ncbi:trypsin-like peptidase domain-containing protein [bacterium]|nr:trypsin-like peptidase domain-containing protein [bacterium]
MDKIFLGKPFKLMFLSLLLAVFCFAGMSSTRINAQQWGEDRLLMDLQQGGAELFKEVSPSMIQIFNLDYVSWGGGAGSGYVIDKEGHAITNKHVVANSQIVEVAFFGDEDTGVRHKAIVIGEDPQLDLAIIKVVTDPKNLHPIKLADSDKVKIGDVVGTLGSPGGDAGNVDSGDRSFSSANWLDFFNFNLGVVDEILDFEHAWTFYSMGGGSGREAYGQYYGSGVQYLFHVSSAINHGNSGGPCINANAEAIGTNTWGYGGLENVGFSVPTNFLKRSARDIIQYGRALTPWFGVLCHPSNIPYKWAYFDSPLGITNEWDLWFDVEVDYPVVQHVNPYSPAYKAGIREGDKILSIDNIHFSNVFELYKYFLNGRIGQKVTAMIERNGVGLAPITVELAEKKVRYDTIRVNTYSMKNYSKPYQATLTY